MKGCNLVKKKQNFDKKIADTRFKYVTLVLLIQSTTLIRFMFCYLCH